MTTRPVKKRRATAKEPVAWAERLVTVQGRRVVAGDVTITPGFGRRGVPLYAAPPASDAERRDAWQPTHRHVKRGSEYRVVGEALMQSAVPVPDDASLVVYVDKQGTLWVRPTAEFNDGRFAAISAAQPEGEGTG